MISSADDHYRLAASYHAWWRDAGVDYVCDGETVNWLEAPAEPSPKIIEKPASVVQAPIVSTQPVQDKITQWPETIAELKQAIAAGAALPGCNYGSACVPPLGEMGAKTFVLVDCPEEEEVAAGRYGAGLTGALLTNMLLAARILPDFTYQTALASSRSATNSIAKSEMAQLAAFALHQIALIKPEIVILFGSAACEAMLGLELMQARGDLHYFNHHDRKTAAVATFHPRTLIAQPRMKSKAWQDLLMVARKDFL